LTVAAIVVLAGITARTVPQVEAQTAFQRISGEGSALAANAIDAWRVDVRRDGMIVDYNPAGSTAGRRSFLDGRVDFAASDIPFQFAPTDGSPRESPAPGSYAYVPTAAVGTAFMYNLLIDGRRVTNLRLSGENVTKIFTGVITRWSDPALRADNPGLDLPDRPLTPVVRSDGSGTSSQLTTWMAARHPGLWNDYCARSGSTPPCGPASFYPRVPGMIGQAGDLGVAGYVSQTFAEGSIGYVAYTYALGVRFPVAKLLNEAGYYTEPTPGNVAISLRAAELNDDPSDPATYLTADLAPLYADSDPRTYELSGYSYLIVPLRVGGQFNEVKGRTLAAFVDYALCEGQQAMPALGHAPLPLSVVTASFEQLRRIPGADVDEIGIDSCPNPTFTPTGADLLDQTVPVPPACDALGGGQCATGTVGLPDTPTAAAVVEAGLTIDPESGGTDTPITIVPDNGPATCPDDSSAGFVWQTFLVAAPVRPALLSYDSTGPRAPRLAVPLVTTNGTALVGQPTDGGSGAIPSIPAIALDRTLPGTVPPGGYRIGVACTIGGRTVAVWSRSLTIEPGPDGLEFRLGPPSAMIMQRIDVERPPGALILTQRCGVFGALPAQPSTRGFPGSPRILAAVPASSDAVGTAPTLGLDGSGSADPMFAAYQDPAAPSYPTTCGVELGTAALVVGGDLSGQFFSADGRLNQVTVVDTRDADAGWTVTGRMSPLAQIGNSFSGNFLGWMPIVSGQLGSSPAYEQVADAGPVVPPGSGIGGGAGLADGATLASARPGEGLGIAVLDARLTLLVPVTAPAGDYTGRLTLTLS
jgi:phosphate transport system substrate-binding protein